MEERREVEQFILPVREVAAGWAVADSMAINEKDEAIVCTDADAIAGRGRTQTQIAAEVENNGFAQRRCWMGDPSSGPFPLGRVGLERGLGSQSECTKSEDE
jgi:hypothetical protein